jgi:CYTH domain-containing protein
MEKIELIRDKNGYINIKFSNETSKLDEYEFVALIQDSIELLKSQLLSIEVES